jgi:hypothetical protein
MPLSDSTDIITNSVTGMQTELLTVAGAGVAIGVAILVVRKGYRLVKGFF